MTISANGIYFIKQHEGLRLTAYSCAAGHATIGYGHDTTNDAQPAIVGKTTITLEQAEELLRRDIEKYERAVNYELRGTWINQNQFDALVSLCFNVGIGAFSRSKFLQMIRNNCSNPAIAKGFESFGNVRNKEGKLVPNNGLLKRRKAEAQLYFTQ